MPMAALFEKYQTKSGRCYVYDVGTNEIIQVGTAVFALLDDFRILDTNEMIQKYHMLGEEVVSAVLGQLDSLQARGILCDHAPVLAWPAEQVLCRGKTMSFPEFLSGHARMLTLELTQECNLRCKYCCYGGDYPDLRTHGQAAMSFEMAEAAIRHYLARHPRTCNIGFYGGEPLLEFDLLRRIVFLAKKLAAQEGLETEFSVSTNGTLLNDDRIHFLAAHNFAVSISLDGPREIHNRYRVFRNTANRQGRQAGTFEVVQRNVRRFKKLYPHYGALSINLTLTATSAWDKVNAFLEHNLEYFAPSVGYVRDVPPDYNNPECDWAFRMGVYRPICRTDSNVSRSKRQPTKTVPDYSNWNKERMRAFYSCFDNFVDQLCSSSDGHALRKSFPLFCELFRFDARNIHHRVISQHAERCTFPYRCYPGCTRTFCSAKGALFPCEKTGEGWLVELGDAATGISVERARRQTEVLRLVADCGNCVGRRFCGLCVGGVSERQDADVPYYAWVFQDGCGGVINTLTRKLEDYTHVMEANPGVLDIILLQDEPREKDIDVKFQLSRKQLGELDRANEQMAESL